MRTKYDSVRGRGASAQRTYYVQGHRVEQHRGQQGHSSWTCDCSQDLRLAAHGAEDSCKHQQHVIEAITLGRMLRE